MSDREFFECFACRKVLGAQVGEKKCQSCGSTNGQLKSGKSVAEGMAAGTYFNIDLNTGRATKKKRR